MEENTPACLYCDQSSDRVPLLSFEFQGQKYWICPQHLPILIHKPSQLASKLPGMEELGPVEGHDH